MDNDEAYEFLLEGGVLLLLDVPEGTDFGIDMKCWKTGPKFKGVKMIPPGVHFVFYSSTNEHGDVSPRSSFFHYFSKGEFVFKKWDKKEEDLIDIEMSCDECDRYKRNLRDLDPFLGAYPFDTLNKWTPLVTCVTAVTIGRLMPQCTRIKSAPDLIAVEKDDACISKKRWSKSRTEEERQEDLLPELVPIVGTQIRYLEWPKQRYPKGSTPAEISAHYMDSSYALMQIIANLQNPLEFIGEMQFAFAAFLLGLNMDAFDHWKRLVQLCCSCEKAVIDLEQVYKQFLCMLQAQLNEIPEEFLADIVSCDNVVYRSLRDLFATLEAENRAKAEGELLKMFLTNKFGWDFTTGSDEDEEYKPVIVET